VTVRTVSHSQVASVGGIHAQLLAIFQTELDSGLHYRPVDGLHGGWGEAVESAVEGIVLGHELAIEVRKGAQGIAVLDAFAPLAIVPVLDAHEHERAPGLRRGNPVAAGVGVLQPAHPILAHWLDQCGWVVQEDGDALPRRVEVDALAPLRDRQS